MRVINAAAGETIFIGHEGENKATQVQFDIARWVDVYGEGRAELLCQRQNDPAPYPVAVERDGNRVIWTVTSADTAQPGRYGRAELRYCVGDTLVKSAISQVIVEDSLGEPGETPPAAYQSWVDDVLDAAERAEAAANRAGGAEGCGISSEALNLICNLLEKAVYTEDVSAQLEQLNTLLETGGSGDDSGETEVTLVRISAAYSGGSVPVGTSVSALAGVKVTAHYSDGSTATVTGYTLSGTIKEGSNTVTVSYGGKTAAFTVTGVADDSGDDNTGDTETTAGAENLTVEGATATDDGNGNVTVTGMTAVDDGNGNMTVS